MSSNLSKVITDHVEKESEAKKPEMKLYLEAVRSMEKHFMGFTIIHIPRDENHEEDKLTKAVAYKEALPPNAFYEKYNKSFDQTVGAESGPTHDYARKRCTRRSKMQLFHSGRSDYSRGPIRPVTGEDWRRPMNARPGGTPSGKAHAGLF